MKRFVNVQEGKGPRKDLWEVLFSHQLSTYHYLLLTPVLTFIEHLGYRIAKLSSNLTLSVLNVIVFLIAQF